MIYGDEKYFAANVMFVNCAHGKGIKFTRDEIKFFAKTNSQPGIPFKSVVLLNADHLTIDAQSALRRCIEQYSKNTRFFIVVENKNKLLDPILSRFCEIYVPSLEIICEKENERVAMIDPFLEMFSDREVEHEYVDMVRVVQELYENAFSCSDIIDWIQTRPEWTKLEKANIGMCFSKVKVEYRCEKLLMLFILSVTVNDACVDLSRISFL
jgi:DNA polymerase III delta prime subunit